MIEWEGVDKSRTYQTDEDGKRTVVTDYVAPGWKDNENTIPNYRLYGAPVPGTCGVRLIAHGTGAIEGQPVLVPNQSITRLEIGEPRNPKGSTNVVFGISSGPFHDPETIYTNIVDQFEPLLTLGRNKVWGIRKYSEPGAPEDILYTWAYTIDNGATILNAVALNEDFTPTAADFEEAQQEATLPSPQRKWHYLGQQRNGDVPIILWRKGSGFEEWVVAYGYGVKWWRGIQDWCGDRTQGREPLINVAMSNIGIYPISSGRYLLVGTTGTYSNATFTAMPIRGNEVYLQSDGRLPHGGGIYEITSVMGIDIIPDVDPVALDVANFKYDLQRVHWDESFQLNTVYKELTITCKQRGTKYVVYDIHESGELGYLVGYFNHSPLVTTEDAQVDIDLHEHWMLPRRMLDSQAIDVFPREGESDMAQTPDRPNVPWEITYPIGEEPA